MQQTPNIETLDSVLAALREALPHVQAVYLFGSAATGRMRADSDMDFAVLCPRAKDPVAIWELAQRLASIAGRDVDLIDLRSASTVMAAHIVVEGQRLLCADENACAFFEAHALADYARLNEERRGILEDIQRRGRVYARESSLKSLPEQPTAPNNISIQN